MGIESYLLRLRCERLSDEVVAFMRKEIGVIPDSEQRPLNNNYSYFVFKDGFHVIEYEIARRGITTAISMQFSLCHPTSVDFLFTNQACTLICQFNTTATICEEVPAGVPSEYTEADLNVFISNCHVSIAHARGKWMQEFALNSVGLSTSDACRKYFYKEEI